MTSSSSIEEVKGDLFKGEKSSLAHCISRDIKMGKGIALIFKQKFGGVDELQKQNKKVGEVAVLERNGRYIYYLITKEKYYNKPTYDTLRQTLVTMVDHMVKNNVKVVSMPRIGCGLDKLIWDKVKVIIEEVTLGKSIKVIIYSL